MVASLRTAPLSSICLAELLTKVEPVPEIAMTSYEQWLHAAMHRAETAATRRLVSDVLEDVRLIGAIDDELSELIIGALGSIEIALELEQRTH